MRTIDLNAVKHDAKRLGWRMAWGTALLAAAPTMLGCQQRGDPSAAPASKDMTGIPGEQFTPADEPRHVHRVLDAQAASGARRDATLRAYHFEPARPGALNSLGEQKLALMVSDDDALPLVVHIDAPIAGGDTDPALANAREQSVRVYLRDRGLADNQVTVVAGRKPDTYAPTAPMLKASQAAEVKAAGPGQGGANIGMTVK